MTWDADCLMDTERTTMVQRRPDIYNQYTKRRMNAMTKGSHPWGAESISKRLFPLSEDAMRHLENGTAAMFEYLIHDGRKTIELEELSTLIPQAWSKKEKNQQCEEQCGSMGNWKSSSGPSPTRT